MKLNGIGSNEHFDGVSAFTAEISGLPQSIQDEAKKIDGEAYNASCFEMYIYYDLETGAFTVSTEKDPATGEDCNVYYVDDNGDKHWFKVEMPEEFTSEVFAACTKNMEEKIHGYEVKRSVVFENNRGFALAENPDAPQPFVTWQFSENENGRRDYYWGHYTTDGEAALRDYFTRIMEYQEYGVPEKETYKYYATQHPIDIGTIPQGQPIRMVSFDMRECVEQGQFRAWGYVVYDIPLSDKQIADYELRAARGNPDVKRRMSEQAQAVGEWEEKRNVPEIRRFTWWYPDFGSFVTKEYISPEQLEERYRYVMESRNRTGRQKPIAEQMKEGAEQAARDNATRPTPPKDKDRGDR